MLPKSFYNKDTKTLAKDLLGRHLIHKNKIGMIVETEAYLGPHDKGAHSRVGRTKRTSVLFDTIGHSYVYLIYGIYSLFNITSADEGGAVLIRALEPIKNVTLKTSGPGLLTKALKIDRLHNNRDLTNGGLYLEKGVDNLEIVSRPRIGINYAEEWKDKKLRFYIKNNEFVSKL
ncbi:MAG TPA: DNA-3-methyladenine glycosylase [bacterium]|nr:DNA-3-methyladenine glycosylase [bacterium]